MFFSLGVGCGSEAIVEDWRMRQVIVIKVTAFTVKISFSHRHSFNCVYYNYMNTSLCLYYICICVFILEAEFFFSTIKKKKILFVFTAKGFFSPSHSKKVAKPLCSFAPGALGC